MADGLARVAEHDGGARIEEAQDVDHRVLGLVGGDQHGAVLDVAVRHVLHRVDAHRVLLVGARQVDDVLGQGGGEQQGAALGRGGVEDELQVLAEAEVEHLVGLVEHDGAQGRGVEIAALQMVAQAPRGGDDDMGAALQHPLLAARVHAADADGDAGLGRRVEPL